MSSIRKYSEVSNIYISDIWLKLYSLVLNFQKKIKEEKHN